MKNTVHFVGIGGAGCACLARLTKSLGFFVTGSDILKTPLTEGLEKEDIKVYHSHKKENISEDVRLVVYSSAVSPENPELISAAEKNIPLMERAEFLGKVMAFFKNTTAVSGTHGKSTVSAMISAILTEAGLSPTCLIGADAPLSDFGYKEGEKDFLVAEACEYRDGFLNLNPFAGIILNVEYEHPDYFKTMEEEISSFRTFAEKVNPLGFLVVNARTDRLFNISQKASCQTYTFGTKEKYFPDFFPKNLRENKGFFSFDFWFGKEFLGKVTLSVPGQHNVMNALASGGCAHIFGIKKDIICSALSSFSGVKRRLEFKGFFNGARLYDDYAHHPSEISASLKALKKMSANKLICLFQPHTYSRTAALFDGFVAALSLADEVILAPIYAAREKYTEKISSENLSDSLKACGCASCVFSNLHEIGEYLKKNLTVGSTLVVMGAGDVNQVLKTLK